MFIALLLRAMKRDVNLKRVAAFSKRLLQVTIKLHFLCRFHFIDTTTDFCLFRLHFSSHHNMPVHAFFFFPNFLKPDHLYGNFLFSVLLVIVTTTICLLSLHCEYILRIFYSLAKYSFDQKNSSALFTCLTGTRSCRTSLLMRNLNTLRML